MSRRFVVALALGLGLAVVAVGCSGGEAAENSPYVDMNKPAAVENGLVVPEGLTTVEELAAVLNGHRMIVQLSGLGSGPNGGSKATFYPNGDADLVIGGAPAYRFVGGGTYVFSEGEWYIIPEEELSKYPSDAVALTMSSFLIPLLSGSAFDGESSYTLAGVEGGYRVSSGSQTVTFTLDDDRQLVSVAQAIGDASEESFTVTYPPDVPSLKVPESAGSV